MDDEQSRKPFGWFTSIRQKLILYAVAVLAVPSLLYSALVFDAARTVLEPTLEQHLTDDAHRSAVAVRYVLRGTVGDVARWGRLEIMREIIVQDVDKTISRFLEQAKVDREVFLDLLVVDSLGVCRASSDPALIGLSEVRGSDAVPGRVVGELRDADELWPRHLEISSQIRDPDDSTRSLGSLIAKVDLGALQSLLRHPDALDQSMAPTLRIIDSRGRVVVGPVASENPTPSTFQEDPYDTSDSMVVSVPVQIDTAGLELGWKVSASLPRALALQPIEEIWTRILAVAAGVGLAGIALAWVLSSHLSRPLRSLTSVTSRISAQGSLEKIPHSDAYDEIGDLTRSFEIMVGAIEAANERVVHNEKLAFLGELSAGIAHEIRTPLGIIRSSSQLLERRLHKAGDEEGVEFSQFIAQESDRLNAVVTDMLRFARPGPLDKTRVDLNGVIERAVQFLRPEATVQGVTMTTKLQDEIVAVECDEGQMYQVCLNLLLNAIRACGEGGRVQVLSFRERRNVVIDVLDDGPGISEDSREHLFTPFVSKTEGGVGLGLAIVKRIVEAHGGTVEAGNRENQGARFRARIPGEEQSTRGDRS